MIELTRFTSTGPLTKRIALSAAGTIESDGSACMMVQGTAERVPIADINALAGLIGSLQSNQAITLGALHKDLPTRVGVTTAAKLNGNHRKDLIARTVRHLVYRGPAFALLDFDSKGMPDYVSERLKQAGGFWEALIAVMPALGQVAHVARCSTSAGLFRSDTGTPLRGSDGVHVYVPAVDGSDIERCLHVLHERCWLAGLGWMMVSASGALMERSIVDRMVWGPERLVFEGKPVLVPPLQQDPERRRPRAVAGDELDSVAVCRSLSIAETSKLEELKAREKLRLRDAAAKARVRFIERQAKPLVAAGMSEHAAKQVIARQCEGVLRPDLVLPFDDSELAGKTVADVLAQPERFEGETLADPLEGVDYGRCVAKIMRHPDGTPWIHSFAHGRAVYALKHDAATVRKAMEAAAKDAVLAVFLALALEADVDIIELDQLRRLAVGLSGEGARKINATLKQAQAQRAAELETKRRERKLALRRDARARIPVPEADQDWLPQIGVVNDVLGGTRTAKPPTRNIEGAVTRGRKLALPNMHALDQPQSNPEEDAP